jgi:hypothetical protein
VLLEMSKDRKTGAEKSSSDGLSDEDSLKQSDNSYMAEIKKKCVKEPAPLVKEPKTSDLGGFDGCIILNRKGKEYAHFKGSGIQIYGRDEVPFEIVASGEYNRIVDEKKKLAIQYNQSQESLAKELAKTDELNKIIHEKETEIKTNAKSIAQKLQGLQSQYETKFQEYTTETNALKAELDAKNKEHEKK